jgi:hypothetical protein
MFPGTLRQILPRGFSFLHRIVYLSLHLAEFSPDILQFFPDS